MAQPANNINIYIAKVLEMPLVTLRDISISIRQNMHDYGHNAVFIGPPEGDMDLLFHIVAGGKPLVLILSDLENKIKAFCWNANTTFIQRTAEEVRYDGEWHYRVTYKMRIADIDLFNTIIEKLALDAMDKEFTEVLEKKLSED